jgi:hypothetical protein
MPPPQRQQQQDSIAARLPSRTVSYESAELVTVSELSKLCCTTDIIHPQLSARKHLLVGCSVRVTGVLIYHNYHENYIDIVDPLTYNNHSKNNNNFYNNKDNISTTTSHFSTSTVIGNDVKQPKLPNGATSSSNTTTTIRSSSSSTTSTGTNIPRTSLSNGPRKIFVKRKLPSEERRAVMPNTNNILISSTYTSLDNNNQNIRQPSLIYNQKARVNNPISIRIDVTDVTPFQQFPSTTTGTTTNNICVIGDLIMIVGEIQQIPHMSKHMENNHDICGNKNHNDNTNVVIIRARIARNVNGTNMKLFQEMLLVRRKFIRDQYYGSTDNDDDDDGNSNRVRIGPGCGFSYLD